MHIVVSKKKNQQKASERTEMTSTESKDRVESEPMDDLDKGDQKMQLVTADSTTDDTHVNDDKCWTTGTRTSGQTYEEYEVGKTPAADEDVCIWNSFSRTKEKRPPWVYGRPVCLQIVTQTNVKTHLIRRDKWNSIRRTKRSGKKQRTPWPNVTGYRCLQIE